VGLSAKTVAAAEVGTEIFDVMMLSYSPAYRTEENAITRAKQNNCGVLLKKIFNSGHAVHDNADNATKTFEFIFANPGVHGAIVGTINPDHLRANVEKLTQVLSKK
ncbi:MAG TPA: aldo/keto reductase, partial [Rhodospirillaceae bacterium]|nr:aldo/keto reductase [Rhodospirillaceae bacterium]